MADEKISAMPVATELAAADLVPIVQGGVNKSATKVQILGKASGEDLVLGDAGGMQVVLKDDGTLQIIGWGGTGIQISPGGGDLILFTATGVFTFPGLPTADPGVPGQWYVQAGIVKVSL